MQNRTDRLRLLVASACVLLTASLAFSLSLSGQTSSKLQLDQMQKLQFLIGEWKGNGVEYNPNGTVRNEFTQKAKVESKANGLELRVKDSRDYKKRLLYGMKQTSTLDASIYYDDISEIYRWRGENEYGRKRPLEAKLVADKTLQYGMPFSISLIPEEGNRRHTIQVTENGDWHETLEVWVNVGWVKAEESTLKRVK